MASRPPFPPTRPPPSGRIKQQSHERLTEKTGPRGVRVICWDPSHFVAFASLRVERWRSGSEICTDALISPQFQLGPGTSLREEESSSSLSSSSSFAPTTDLSCAGPCTTFTSRRGIFSKRPPEATLRHTPRISSVIDHLTHHPKCSHGFIAEIPYRGQRSRVAAVSRA